MGGSGANGLSCYKTNITNLLKINKRTISLMLQSNQGRAFFCHECAIIYSSTNKNSLETLLSENVLQVCQ